MIELQNPWWFGEPDRDWELFEKLTCRLRPKWLDELSLRPFSLNFVVGPRRVGKTLGIKLLIRELLKKSRLLTQSFTSAVTCLRTTGSFWMF